MIHVIYRSKKRKMNENNNDRVVENICKYDNIYYYVL